MDKSTCVIKTYHPKIDKLQCWEKKPFYTTYAPRTRMQECETQPMIERVSPHGRRDERTLLIIMVVILLVLLTFGMIVAHLFY